MFHLRMVLRLSVSNCRHAMIIRTEVPDLSVFREVKSLVITLFNAMENQFYLLKDIPSLNLLPSSHIDDFIIR